MSATHPNFTVVDRVLLEKKLQLYEYQICANDLRQFCKSYLSHHFPLDFCSFHDDLFDDLSRKTYNKRMVRIAPRGHGKTTIVCMAYALWCLAFCKKKSILLVGSNQTHADNKLQDIISEIENNEKLLKHFTHLKPKKDFKKQFVKYTDSHIHFMNDAQIYTKGMRSAVRGFKPRPDLIIIDDPEKDEDLEVPSTRDRNKKWFDRVIRFLGGAGKTMDIMIIDTLKHYDALIKYVFDKPGWDAKKYSAVIDDEKRQVLWSQVYCYDISDMTDFEKENWLKKGSPGFENIREPFYGMYYENESDLHPKIVGIADEQPESFTQEFLAQPARMDEMPLRSDLWKPFDYSQELFESMNAKIGALDLSMGKKSADFQAIAILGRKERDYYLLDGTLSRYDMASSDINKETLIGLCVEKIKQYKLKTFIVEDNNFQALFANELAKELHKLNIYCSIRKYTSKGDKIERIFNELGIIIQRGSFFVRRDYAKYYPTFMKQFEYFPKADHDDAPDVTHIALRGIQKIK